ncbi:CPBP family intramembrane glutamic endopeptidase [Oryzihumus leptocrescens]|uniref:CAAX prenyl protease-like protein n=1 Tax=Oryzihumus leptocrescens TaxID=297536 RepID=A0A542ZMU1_9MICO|nr:type II CAAX endopeptidase family protein [Oryzihumus leptocrescens]TQL61671.1 CAAX prenyl protease-like protein [Oryzihumus leptocrescens]
MRTPGRCFLLTVAVLLAFTVLRGLGLAGPPGVSVPVLLAALALVAAWSGASLADLGLEPAALPAGLRYGVVAFAAVGIALALAAEIPMARAALHDQRGEISGGHLLYELLVTVVLLTAIPEEFAFRGVLLGSASALWGPRRAGVVTAVLFGLWHVQPTLQTMADNAAVSGASSHAAGQVALVVGAVVVTFVAGLAFAWLRLRSRSLVAPVLAHVATNGLALVAAWAVLHGRLP